LAARELTGRVGWLAAVTIIVVLASSQLLFELAGYGAYALALRDAAYATIVGDPLTATGVLARVMEIVLLI
jgi:voltage-gated potassium channel